MNREFDSSIRMETLLDNNFQQSANRKNLQLCK